MRNIDKHSHFGPVPRKIGIIFILCLPFLVFYWQIPFISSQVMGNDYTGFPIKQQLELQYSLAHGTVPLYAPGFAGGQTAAALSLGQFYHPISHLSAQMPGYWNGAALDWNTFFKLVQLGLVHLCLFFLLLRLKLSPLVSFVISFITVYNLRMLDLFRYGASLENYTGYLLLCLSMAFYYLDGISPPPDTGKKLYRRFTGPSLMTGATYLLVTGGHPQMMYIGLLGAGAAALAIPFLLSRISADVHVDGKRLIRFYLSAGVCVLIGIALASAYIIPFYYDFLLTNGSRMGQDFQWSLGYSSSTRGLLNNFFIPLQSELQGAFGGSTLILLIGLIPLLYAMGKKVPAAVAGTWGGLLLVFLLALGKSTPLYYYFWKYFPLAGSFRAPGRITLIFPFLFFLLLAWLFKPGHRNTVQPAAQPFTLKEKIRRFLRTPPGFLVMAAAPLFLLYTFSLSGLMPKLLFCTPAHIDAYPAWIDTLTELFGFLTLILVGGYWVCRNKTRRTVVGVALASIIVVQVAIEFRVSCWVVKKRPEASLVKMDKWKKKSLGFRHDPGFGMEADGIVNQRHNSVLDPQMARFYRKYEEVRDNRAAYRYIRKEPVAGIVVIEAEKGGALAALQECESHKKRSVPGFVVDRVVLKEATFNRVLFTVEAGSSGFFTLSYPYLKGWRANIDGKSAPVFRANGYMLAVPVGEGRHLVEFRFRSEPAFWGILISCSLLFLLAVYLAVFVLKGKRRLVILLIGAGLPIFLLNSWNSGVRGGDNLGTRYQWNSKAFPHPRNLAYARKAFINSGRALFYAGLAVDGDKHGTPFQTIRKKQGIFQIDLGSPRRLGEIVIYDKKLNGRRHVPLEIQGSIKGREYFLLGTKPKRGKNNPWRIGMNGEIARYIRLVSASKTILSFSEVEVYPPEDMPGQLRTAENPLIKLLPVRPVNKEVLSHIGKMAETAVKGDLKTLEELMEKSVSLGPGLKKFILYDALHRAVITGTPGAVELLIKNGAAFDLPDMYGITPIRKAVIKKRPGIAAVLRNSGAMLSPFDTNLEPDEVIDGIKAIQLKSRVNKEIKVWNPGKRDIEALSPQMTIFGKWGTFRMVTAESQYDGKIIFPLKVWVPVADKKNRRRVNFGFELNSRGFTIENPGGEFIHLVVSVKVPSHLCNRQNFITIRDMKKKWQETSRAYFNTPGWRTYLVSKKIRTGVERLVLMVRFTPDNSGDEILVRDIRVLVSQKGILNRASK